MRTPKVNITRTVSASVIVLGFVALLQPVPCFGGTFDDALKIELSFNRDIRPVLSAKCFACHGPDEDHREAGLRLDREEDAREFGVFEIDSDEDATFLKRIKSDDENELMPPPHAGKPLTQEEKQTLVQWVQQGANYEAHWAFVTPVKTPLTETKNAAWPQNEIDAFVLSKIEARNQAPAEAADRYTLVRRVYLDLIGLPPTIDQADQFVNSSNPEAYENLVDELLASPRYGEHWATAWLDLARYADTNGYEKDRMRSMWPYRDWVVKAFNDDKPYDQFTIEQLAGDMLPNATESQNVATAFHRNTMLNEEGGIDPNEYRFHAIVDRVATTGTVWMGLTTGCAQCHTHKYDPITHTDFYRLYAILNNTDEVDFSIRDREIEKVRNSTLKEIQKLENALPNQIAQDIFEPAFNAWLLEQKELASIEWTTPNASSMKAESVHLKRLEDGSIFAIGDPAKRDVYELDFELTGKKPIAAIRIRAIPDSRLPGNGPGLTAYEGRKGDFFLSEFSAFVGEAPLKFKLNADSSVVLDSNGSTGWRPGPQTGIAKELILTPEKPIPAADALKLKLLFERHYSAGLGRFKVSFTDTKVSKKTDPNMVLDFQNEAACRIAFAKTTPLLAKAREPIDQLRASMPELPYAMVMRERKEQRRKSFRHHRGEYLNPREKVVAGIPQFLADSIDDQDFGEQGVTPINRLDFAHWIASSQNPLIARVAVNRAWRAFFGSGLVRTPGDFGVQCDVATHPELLDWLAVDFMENGWSTKRLHRQIVLSATYRQSVGSQSQARSDPENKLLSRMPRFRLSGETVRDSMLMGSRLLSEKMYGPGVFPPQPRSVTALAYGAFEWNESVGEDRYRRSIYTFKKRTAPFAAFTVFDAPTGESCAARRNRSNTPLQALTLLNDKMFVEMAHHLASYAEANMESSPSEKLRFVFRSFLTRPPETEELNKLIEFYSTQLQRFESGELMASEVTGSKTATNENAALTLTARVIMNLDEAITRP